MLHIKENITTYDLITV